MSLTMSWKFLGFGAELLGGVGPAIAGLFVQFVRPRVSRGGIREDDLEVQEAFPVPECIGSAWLWRDHIVQLQRVYSLLPAGNR